MNIDLPDILTHLDEIKSRNEVIQENDYFIENAEFLLNDNIQNELYSYILRTIDNISEIHIDRKDKIDESVRDYININVRVNGILTEIGLINKDGIAIIDNERFSTKNRIRKLDNFGHADEVINIIYVQSKGLYRLRITRSPSVISIRVLLLYKFQRNKSLDKVNVNVKYINEFKVLIDNFENFKHVILNKPYNYMGHNNLMPLNIQTECNNLKLDEKEKECVNQITKSVLTLRFKFCPVFERENDGSWTLNLVSQYYLVGYSVDNLLSFIHSKREMFKCKLWNNFYRELEVFFNDTYDINIEFNERTDIKELKNIIKALDY